MRYKIKGLTRDRGEPRELVLEAGDEDSAIRLAGDQGLVVEAVHVVWDFPGASRDVVAIFALVSSVYGWLWTLHSPPRSPGLVMHYGAMICAGAVVGFLASRAHPRWHRQIKFASLVVTIAAICVWWQVDHYERRWESDGGIRYIDWCHRGDADPYYRYVYADDWYAEGGFTASGQQHGEWEYRVDGVPLDQSRRSMWFWYGEEVTEGEWHLRTGGCSPTSGYSRGS